MKEDDHKREFIQSLLEVEANIDFDSASQIAIGFKHLIELLKGARTASFDENRDSFCELELYKTLVRVIRKGYEQEHIKKYFDKLLAMEEPPNTISPLVYRAVINALNFK